ncbi:MAG TPA: hypothetical protein VE757_06890 [Gaiellaceae bacterium]|nr:hypothetical protein [Gaiellaceae bacterium]
MASITNGRGPTLATGEPVREGGCVGGGRLLSLSPVADIRRFRVKHALKSIEDALILLDEERPNGVHVGALERIRDDLAVVLRVAEAEARS